MTRKQNEKIKESKNDKNILLNVIREKCLECVCNSSNEIKVCSSLNCKLWNFRFGEMPNSKELEIKGLLPFLNKDLIKGKHNMKSEDLIKEIEKLSNSAN